MARDRGEALQGGVGQRQGVTSLGAGFWVFFLTG